MTDVITIGVDLAKNVFQVHGVDAEDGVIFRRQLRRGQILPFFKKQRPLSRPRIWFSRSCLILTNWTRLFRTARIS